MIYVLDVEFKTFIDEQADQLTDFVKSVVGREPDDKGSGGGYFDMQFDFDSRLECEQTRSKIEANPIFECEIWEWDENAEDLKFIS